MLLIPAARVHRRHRPERDEVESPGVIAAWTAEAGERMSCIRSPSSSPPVPLTLPAALSWAPSVRGLKVKDSWPGLIMLAAPSEWDAPTGSGAAAAAASDQAGLAARSASDSWLPLQGLRTSPSELGPGKRSPTSRTLMEGEPGAAVARLPGLKMRERWLPLGLPGPPAARSGSGPVGKT